ncbi:MULTISPECIES: transporter substrate-binding domain-containing protein [unclassified Herbaspirillum]|uniref:transporter substrate-binding domain-containing protein n=1 Tax=unclassified Herbaspirillum TaxID=2624150 RepID=UPI00116FCE64|nr:MULTISPECIES: transporter substrate-binding domain-containing protein [unclassified Herbaspirillum]MBB5390917.1 polar amino acid transport system substrate-binding protein [Herbaspirillum sp. SJZ102]TQK06441.1 amino acid ABC transporter substrate-binding protein (PAAT family) [Herbaspirillum sp. SJZ130]TQK12081.1 amino acid ABC transporter substrate-binding protein (PAAT family) [Herbaspirillum sp. SJZ106]TWC64591.1 amino acid ABC transporter substrate-binding protein (PAAT family) [Herbaspi
MISGRIKKPGMGAAALAALLVFSAAAHADRLADIKARGSLICATLPNNEPLAFTDPWTHQVVGFDVDMCSAVARELGVKMSQKSVTVAERLPVLIQGDVDLVVAALGYTRERARQIDFTAAHYQNPIRVIVHSDSGISKMADLADKRISANRDSTPEQAARRMLPKATVQVYPDTSSAFLALAQNKVDGLALSQPSGIRFVSESDGKFRFVDGTLLWEPTAMGVKKGEPALLAAVNAALVTLEKSGEIDALWNKWYGPKSKFNIPREKKLTPISAFQ